jgi:hypothetical protein
MTQELVIESDEACELAERLSNEWGISIEEVVVAALRAYAASLNLNVDAERHANDEGDAPR